MEETTTVEETPARIRNFIARHKVSLAVGATAVTAVVLHARIIKKHNDFLVEHDLYDEYYYSEDIDEA